MHLTQLNQILDSLEAQMRQLDLWQQQPICSTALQSTMPFAVDTMSFAQWLQFVLLAKLRQLIAQQAALPSKTAIAAMAEQVYAESYPTLVAILRKLDCILNEPVK